MYVDNGKISARQTFRLFVFDFMGIATLLLPPYLSKLCGVDGIWVILIGSILGFVYMFYLKLLMKKMGSDIMSFLKEKKGCVARRITQFLVGGHCIITAGFLAYVFAKLMMDSLVQEVSYEWIILVIVAMAIYAVKGGIESRARVYEVLFFIILIPYVAMVLASIRNFEVRYVEELFVTSPENMLKGIYLIFLLITPMFFSLFLVRDKGTGEGSIIKSVAWALGVTSVILLGSYVLLLGNFGAKSLATMDFPIVTLMSTIQFEGNFLKRMDALMVAVWFFTLFALLNLHLHYATMMCKEIKAFGKKKWIANLLPAGAVYVVAYVLGHNRGGVELFLDYYSYVAVPLMIVGPAVLLLEAKSGEKKMKKIAALGMVLTVVMLTGCTKTGLEERCFPLLAVVDYDEDKKEVSFGAGFPHSDSSADSTGQTKVLQVATEKAKTFDKSKKTYEENLNKEADYNHLKVLVLGETFVKNKEIYDKMLESLAQSEEFPRNTYVCVVSDTNALLELDKDIPQDLGTYLEELLINHGKKKNKMLTLGDLLDEKENQILVLCAPYLIPEDTYVSFDGYCTIGGEEIFFYEDNE